MKIIRLALVLLALSVPRAVAAFPPYRLTDAGTADLRTLEFRFGVISLSRDSEGTEYVSPLLRVNYGLAEDLEILSEFEYAPEAGRLGDAALGLKWVPFRGSTSFGGEALALLPTSSRGGSGVEALLLATHRSESFQIHANAGGFHDARSDESRTGWKGGVLAEWLAKGFRPGLQIFASQVRHDSVHLIAGPGVIVDLGRMDIRAGISFGVTRAAPEVSANLWLTTKFPLKRRG